MKTAFSKTWKASKKPGKQRKYASLAPKHIKGKLMGAHFSKELREKYKKRALRAITGDKVKVTRGAFKGKTGAIENVDIKNQRVYITNVEYTKKDGSKSKYPVHVSNIIITELKLDDKKRKQKLEASAVSQKETNKQKLEISGVSNKKENKQKLEISEVHQKKMNKQKPEVKASKEKPAKKK